MKEKILTQHIVDGLGLDKLSVITANMLDEFTSIGDCAFYSCQTLTSITIPNSITSIGEEAFLNCLNLTSITIPNSVTHIRDRAFAYCEGLTSVTIPNSVTSIGDGAFESCVNLTSAMIGSSVTHIGDYAFAYCYKLLSITIPNNVTNIGYFSFGDCVSFGNCGFKQEKKIDKQSHTIAYKGFNVDMTCLGFKYEEGKTYELFGKPKLCEIGFHACLNPLDCFAYYYGEIGKDVVFHEVYLDGMSDEKRSDSKVVAKKITIGREITLSEMADIASGRK